MESAESYLEAQDEGKRGKRLIFWQRDSVKLCGEACKRGILGAKSSRSHDPFQGLVSIEQAKAIEFRQAAIAL